MERGFSVMLKPLTPSQWIWDATFSLQPPPLLLLQNLFFYNCVISRECGSAQAIQFFIPLSFFCIGTG